MLTRNIEFYNFNIKKKLKLLKIKKDFLRFNNLVKTFPLLKSYSKNYRYSYKKKLLVNIKIIKVSVFLVWEVLFLVQRQYINF